jgi:hypothetical protein
VASELLVLVPALWSQATENRKDPAIADMQGLCTETNWMLGRSASVEQRVCNCLWLSIGMQLGRQVNVFVVTLGITVPNVTNVLLRE